MSAAEAGTGPAVTSGRPDRESDEWVRALTATGRERDDALERLHTLVLRVARGELARRAAKARIAGPELDDLAYQAAHDALMAITRKVSQFRGESRFTTWAYRFVILEVSAALGRHFWRMPTARLDTGDWSGLTDRLGLRPEDEAEWRDLIAALRRAVAEVLTEHQRQVFAAIVLDGIPLDAVALQRGTNRNALYKTMFDARRKLRAALAAEGYLNPDPGGPHG